MQIITEKEINSLNIPTEVCFEWVSDMISNKSKQVLPPKVSFSLQKGTFCNIMPSIITNENGIYAGVKTVTRFPNKPINLESKILLIDMATGDYLALIDSNWITSMRTGAVAAHSVKLFAKDNFNVISIIGLGNTAYASLLNILTIFPNKKFTVKLFEHNNEEISFISKFKSYKNINFVVTNNKKTFIQGSDVIISCVTYMDEDFCPVEYFDKGVLLIPVHTRGFSNCDKVFDKIFGDDYNHICNFKYFKEFKNFSETSEVVSGKFPGRENNNERIIAYNVGISIHDINYASHIYNLINNN